METLRLNSTFTMTTEGSTVSVEKSEANPNKDISDKALFLSFNYILVTAFQFNYSLVTFVHLLLLRLVSENICAF